MEHTSYWPILIGKNINNIRNKETLTGQVDLEINTEETTHLICS
jgi:hypothetical protein